MHARTERERTREGETERRRDGKSEETERESTHARVASKETGKKGVSERVNK